MNSSVIVFPGSNCDMDMVYVLETIMGQEVVKLWHKDTDLQGCEFIVLPGGFSYGDYLRSGAIARFSPIMEKVIEFANNGGYVMGICNGFQILCESGLLPGALLHNNSHKFICKNVNLSTQTTNTLVTNKFAEGQNILIPIAHGEGRYHCDQDTLKRLVDNDLIALKYNTNPNGSTFDIAGITNEKGNVLGLMPHPERACDESIGGIDGLYTLKSLIT